jgi:hypothetical protein
MKLCFVSESGEGNYESFLNTENDPCVFAKFGDDITVRDGHGGGWSRKINAWHLYTLMVYL